MCAHGCVCIHVCVCVYMCVLVPTKARIRSPRAGMTSIVSPPTRMLRTKLLPQSQASTQDCKIHQGQTGGIPPPSSPLPTFCPCSPGIACVHSLLTLLVEVLAVLIPTPLFTSVALCLCSQVPLLGHRGSQKVAYICSEPDSLYSLDDITSCGPMSMVGWRNVSHHVFHV